MEKHKNDVGEVPARTSGPDVETAQDIARAMVHREAGRSGGQERALRAIETRHGIRPWQIRELLSRPNPSLVAKIWAPLVEAYRRECERQIKMLEGEIDRAKTLEGVGPENIRRAEARIAEVRREIGLARARGARAKL